MRDLYPDKKKRWRPNFGRFLLDSDARIDSGMYLAGRWVRELWERFSAFMDRFHVSGWRRWVFVEPFSEGATLGAGGLVVMLALAIPAFRETSDDDWLKKSELAVTFLDRYGNEVGSRGIKHNDSIPLDEFPDHLIKATLATEDRRFYEHFGIDPSGTFRALAANSRAGGVVQGGSSITQQLAKNLFLSNERTIERKIKEAILAVRIERAYTKDKILELYLNRVYFGSGAYGVEAAAQKYFNKSARQVTIAEAAMLAGLVQSPTRLAPNRNPEGARARAELVLAAMENSGFITSDQLKNAETKPANTIQARRVGSINYAADYVMELLDDLIGSIDSDVLVTTTINPQWQSAAEQALADELAGLEDA